MLQGIKPEKERERDRQTDTGTRALMEQRCFNQHGVGIYILSYKVAIFSRDKIKTYKLSRKHEVIHMKERVVNNHFYCMVHKKEEGTITIYKR